VLPLSRRPRMRTGGGLNTARSPGQRKPSSEALTGSKRKHVLPGVKLRRSMRRQVRAAARPDSVRCGVKLRRSCGGAPHPVGRSGPGAGGSRAWRRTKLAAALRALTLRRVTHAPALQVGPGDHQMAMALRSGLFGSRQGDFGVRLLATAFGQAAGEVARCRASRRTAPAGWRKPGCHATAASCLGKAAASRSHSKVAPRPSNAPAPRFARRGIGRCHGEHA
jgi:hypothetical protein